MTNYNKLFDIFLKELGVLYFNYEGISYRLEVSEMELEEYAKVEAPCDIHEIGKFYRGECGVPEVIGEYLFQSRDKWQDIDEELNPIEGSTKMFKSSNK